MAYYYCATIFQWLIVFVYRPLINRVFNVNGGQIDLQAAAEEPLLVLFVVLGWLFCSYLQWSWVYILRDQPSGVILGLATVGMYLLQIVLIVRW